MAELRANSFGVPILFPIYAYGFAHVSSLHPNIMFCLHDASIWVERDIYDPITFLLTSTMRENPIFADIGSLMWKFAASKYKFYGLLECWPLVSTKIRTRPYLSASTFNTLPPFVSRLNIVFTLSHIFLIHLMVMSLFIPFLHAIHPRTPFISPM